MEGGEGRLDGLPVRVQRPLLRAAARPVRTSALYLSETPFLCPRTEIIIPTTQSGECINNYKLSHMHVPK